MIQAMKSKNLLQKKWYVIDSQTAKVKTSKAIQLNLKQNLLNPVFAIILMHLF